MSIGVLTVFPADIKVRAIGVGHNRADWAGFVVIVVNVGIAIESFDKQAGLVREMETTRSCHSEKSKEDFDAKGKKRTKLVQILFR